MSSQTATNDGTHSIAQSTWIEVNYSHSWITHACSGLIKRAPGRSV